MDINLNYSEDDNPLALKSDFILSFCDLAAGGRNGLEPVEKTVIDRAVRIVYRPILQTPCLLYTSANDNGKCPQMEIAHFYVEHWEIMREENIG